MRHDVAIGQFAFWSLGVVGIALFHEGLYLPIIVSALVLVLVTSHLIRLFIQARVGWLTMLLFVAFALPFIHIFPYTWFDFDGESPLILWGLFVNPYMVNERIIELMSMIGAVGAVGFAAGASVFREALPRGLPSEMVAPHRSPGRTLSMPVFLAWNFIAVVLTWISA